MGPLASGGLLSRGGNEYSGSEISPLGVIGLSDSDALVYSSGWGDLALESVSLPSSGRFPSREDLRRSSAEGEASGKFCRDDVRDGLPPMVKLRWLLLDATEFCGEPGEPGAAAATTGAAQM